MDWHSSMAHDIVLSNVGFSYQNGRSVLESVSLSVFAGKVTALMGGSGSGKSTILRLISGLLKTDKGSVVVQGQNLATMTQSQQREFRAKSGFMFQQGALFTDLSVFENVAFPIREHAPFLSEELIRSLVLMKLNAVGLRAVHGLMPSQLSGGMARRVALARAISLDPRFIFYDEPFTGLDPVSLGVTAKLIRQLNDVLGATSVIVSHDVQETFEIADYVYFLAEGKIVASGTPQELVESTHPYVHQFIHAEKEGPVPFHAVGARPYLTDLGLS